VRTAKLTKGEKNIEQALLKGEYRDVDKNMFNEIARTLSSRKKDRAISIRMNSVDLDLIKKKARALGVKYQTLIAELVHQVAHG
jgi:predicted DNA binding CopG/RHH family protein